MLDRLSINYEPAIDKYCESCPLAGISFEDHPFSLCGYAQKELRGFFGDRDLTDLISLFEEAVTGEGQTNTLEEKP